MNNAQYLNLNMKHVLICLLLLVALCGCRERMYISTDNAAPQLVITGCITTDTTWHLVTISQTTGYFGSETPKTYDDATVSINGEPLYALGHGRYYTGSDFFGEPGKTYVLEAYVDKDSNGNLQRYTASATMPPMHELDSITLRIFRYHDGLPVWAIYVNFQDIANFPNLFGAHLYINSEQYSNKLRRYFLNDFDESAADGRYIRFPLITEYVIANYALYWNSDNYYDNYFNLYEGDTLTVDLNMLDRAYFNYLQAAKSEVRGNNPLFAGPPANVQGNIQGGALGIFGAYTTSRKSLIITEEYGFPQRDE